MKLKHLILTLSLAASSFTAQAQFAKPEDAIKYRQAVFTVMARSTGTIGAMMQGRVPFDAAVVQKNAAILDDLANMPWDAFPEGSTTPKTKADIWSNPAKFKESAAGLSAATAKLVAAAKTGDQAQIRTAFGGIGAGACKTCHDAFRN